MEDYQQRVADEAEELSIKRERLENFLNGEVFKSLPKDEQERLTIQWQVMGTYHTVLLQRIERF